MHPYAQTGVQLFNQLRRDGYSTTDLSFVHDAYELAIVVFTGRFQPSGKSFIAHVVGTASILASLRLSAQVVAAGLLHNVYEQGDFGMIRRNASRGKRHKVSRLLGSEVEEYVVKFPGLHWQSPMVHVALDNPDRLASVDRNVLAIRLADYLEHLLDLDLLYYAPIGRRYFTDNGVTAVALADRLGLKTLAVELKEAIRDTESAELPVQIPTHRVRNGSFVVAPRSCRKRLSVDMMAVAIRTVDQLRREVRKLKKSFAAQRERVAVRMRERELLTHPLEAHSDEFTSLFPNGVRLERLATGFQFTEGPVWILEDRSLLFSDIPANRIYGLAADGRITTFRKPSGNSNGLTRDKEGRLVACEHGNRRVTRTEKDASITSLADRFHGKKLNSPNDVVVKSDGAIYFTDPTCGITPDQQEQPLEGVYRLSPDGKEISLVADDLARPNGLAFSPDEKKLYIDDSERRHIRIFDVSDDGSLSGGSLFHDMNVSSSGAPDGMKVDLEGRVYCTGAGGVWVFDPAGNHVGTIVTPEKPSNCAWGDDDWRSLYITAVTSVYKIRVGTPGIRIL